MFWIGLKTTAWLESGERRMNSGEEIKSEEEGWDWAKRGGGGGLEGLGRVLLCCERPCPPYHRLTLVISSNIAAKKLFWRSLEVWACQWKRRKNCPQIQRPVAEMIKWHSTGKLLEKTEHGEAAPVDSCWESQSGSPVSPVGVTE